MSRIEIDKKYEALLAECDQLIKSGQISAIAGRLAQLVPAQVPRKFRQPLAKICRRAGLINRGLRLLQPVVRSEKKNLEPAKTHELCEYAILLSRNGSVQEALNLFTDLQEKETPEALLALAYCHTANWEYEKVAPLLENLLRLDTDPYSKLIARVNLASAYLAISSYEQAEALCTETMALGEASKATRLVANCLEIRGQVHFRRGDFASARADLKRSSEILGTAQVHDQLFTHQWQATMTAIESQSGEPLLKFRQEAVSRKLWESVREADLFTLKVQFDQKRLDHLVYGTPMPAYRERIKDLISASPSEEYILGCATSTLLDLQTGEVRGERSASAEKKIHQVLAALVRDFYSPRNIGTLFSELYPGEYFDINSSALRIRQLLFRTRQWLKDNEISASIEQSDGTYRLALGPQFGIQIRLDESFSQRPSEKWLRLANQFPVGVAFTAEQACEKLQWSRSTFRRVVEAALAHGEIKKLGIGKATTYEIHSLNPQITRKPAA